MSKALDVICDITQRVYERQRQADEKWGFCRLPVLVDADLGVKFRKQQRLYIEACEGDKATEIERRGNAMLRAFDALEAEAEASGAEPVDSDVWEAPFEKIDGSKAVVAIVKDDGDVKKVRSGGRDLSVFTLAEVAKILSHHDLSSLHAVKTEFPGAEIVSFEKNPVPFDPADLDDDVSDLFDGG